ncbi:hypothetical protein DIPPA_20252 [Diplonema papillatum]|nr:hypothetical protein DIPPA_20252 [Diplonema papillatum]
MSPEEVSQAQRKEGVLKRASPAVDGASEETRVAQLLRALEEQERDHQFEIEELEKRRQDDLTALWDEHWRRVNELQEPQGASDEVVQRLRQTVDELERENRTLKEKLEDDPPLHEDLEEELDAKDDIIDKLKSDVVAQKDKARYLESLVEELRDEIARLKREKGNPAEILQRMDRLRKENEALQDRIRSDVKTKYASKETAALKDALREKEQHLGEAQRKAALLERETTDHRGQVDQAVREATEALTREKARELAGLQEELRTLRAEVDRASEKGVTDKTRQEERTAALQRELDTARSDLAAAVRQRDDGAGRDRELIDTQKALLDVKGKELADARARLGEVDDLLERSEAVERLQQRLLREKQDKADNLIALVREQREQISKLERELDRDGSRWERASAGSVRSFHSVSRLSRYDGRSQGGGAPRMAGGYAARASERFSEAEARPYDRFSERASCESNEEVVARIYPLHRERSPSRVSVHSVSRRNFSTNPVPAPVDTLSMRSGGSIDTRGLDRQNSDVSALTDSNRRSPNRSAPQMSPSNGTGERYRIRSTLPSRPMERQASDVSRTVTVPATSARRSTTTAAETRYPVASNVPSSRAVDRQPAAQPNGLHKQRVQTSDRSTSLRFPASTDSTRVPRVVKPDESARLRQLKLRLDDVRTERKKK